MNLLEITGTLFGIAGIYLTTKEKVWCFPVGIVNVLVTAYLVFEVRLYADVLQQVVYFILLLAGWYKWTHDETTTHAPEKIGRLSISETAIYILVWLTGTFILYTILKKFTAAHFPFWDSAGTVLCFIAQWFVAKKKIENWILWMAANSLYIVIYYLKEMPYYSVLMLVYFIMAIYGFMEWRNRLLKQALNN